MQEGDLYGCGDFTYQEDAQKVYDRHPGDPYGLDGPIGEASEGTPSVACEDLPHRPDSGGPGGDQYSPKTPLAPVNNPKGMMPNTTVRCRTWAALLTLRWARCCSWERPWSRDAES